MDDLLIWWCIDHDSPCRPKTPKNCWLAPDEDHWCQAIRARVTFKPEVSLRYGDAAKSVRRSTTIR